MAKYQFYGLALVMLLFACKPSQTVINKGDGKDTNADNGTEKTDSVVKTAGVDTDISSFRVTYDLDNAYEEFGAPKIIKKADENAKKATDKKISSNDHINNGLEKKLSQIRYINSDIDKVMGYRILIYSGNNINKAQSEQSDVRIALSGTGYAATLDYEPPNYIVKVGEFISKLKAHKLLTDLKEDFPSAILVKEEISFDRYNYKRN